MTESVDRLEAALGLALLKMADFALRGGFAIEELEPAFGADLDEQAIKKLADAVATGDAFALPKIEVSDGLDAAGVIAAYVAPSRGDIEIDEAPDLGVIHVSRVYVETASMDALVKTILEEIGHAFDWLLNTTDAPGDEGAIFANLVLGTPMSETQLAALQAEDDHIEIVPGPQTAEAEGAPAETVLGEEPVLAEASQTFVVTTLDDELDNLDGLGTISLANFGGAGDLSLREAIALANADEATADRIEFDAALAGGSIEFRRSFGQVLLTSDMTIDGDIDGDDVYDITVLGAIPKSTTFLRYTTFGTFIAPDAEDTIEINGLYFYGGMHDRGGAIFNAANMTVTNSLFTNNWTLLNSHEGGGAIWNEGDMVIENSDFLDNGTGLANRMVGNYIGNGGGAIRTDAGSLVVRDSYFDTNSGWFGGAIWKTGGSLGVFDSTFNHNVAAKGGAIAAAGTVVLDGVTMTGNVGFQSGPAVFGPSSGLVVFSSTITGSRYENMATYDVAQGWLYSIAEPPQYDVSIDVGVLTVENSIILGNETYFEYRTTYPETLNGANIIGDAATGLGVLTIDGETVLPNIRFSDVFEDGVLRDNGGPVPTIALKASPFNPALDSGDDASAWPTDARGEARVDQPDIGLNGNNISDLGAYELQTVVDGSGVETPGLVVNTAEDIVNAYDGLTSLREAVAYVSSGLAGDAPTISFDGSVFDGEAEDVIVLTQGQMLITQAVTIDAYASDDSSARVHITADRDGDDLDSAGLTLAQGGTGITDLALSRAAGTLDDNQGRIFKIITNEDVELNGLVLTGGRVTGNLDGGAISAEFVSGGRATLTVRNSIVAGNETQGGYGGGIAADSVVLENSVVSGNGTAVANFATGGGIYAYNATLLNSVVTNNFAGSSYGGGISALKVNLTNSIVTGNLSQFGDLDDVEDGSGGTNLYGGNILGGTFSIDGVAQTTGLTPDDIFAATDANSAAGGGKLVLVGGGFSGRGIPTMALKDDAANPAIDGGDDTLDTATDALGVARVDQSDTAHNGSNISDLGAYELRLAQAAVAVNDAVSGNEDTVISGDVSTNDSDPDGGDLWFKLNTGTSNGSLVLNLDGTFDYTPDENFNGTDSFTYLVTDGIDGIDTGTVTITVTPVNDIPVIRDLGYDVLEESTLTADLTLFATDIDGDTITLQGLGTPSHGTAVITAEGALLYTPEADYFGEDSFTYTVGDGNGGTATATIYVTVGAVDDAPIATGDAFSGDEDTVITGDVSLNDSDADGDTLRFSEGIPPLRGTLVFNSDGTFAYTPDENYFGTDSFTYGVSDGNGGTAEATVTLTVNPVNDPPVAEDVSAWAVEDRRRLWELGDYVSDVESTLDDGLWTFELGTPAANGTATVTPAGLLIYEGNENFFGTDSFTYIVHDGDGGSAEATVTMEVRPVNDAPVLTFTLDGPIEENVAGARIGTLGISDPDDTEFLIYVGDALQSVDRLEVVADGDGYIVKLKDGMSFDYEVDGPTLRTFAEVWDDLVIDVGTEGAVQIAGLTILDVNDVAPYDITLSGLTVTENDTGATVGTLAAVDPDGPALTFTVSDARFEVVGDALKLKDGVSLDREAEPSVAITVTASDGTFSATEDFIVTVENVDEGAPENLALSNARIDENATGVIGTLSATDVDGDAITFSVSDSRFSVSGTTLSLVRPLNHETLAGGVFSLEVTATAAGVSTTETFSIEVNDVNEAPELTATFGQFTGYTGDFFDLPVLENETHATASPEGNPFLYPISFVASDVDGDDLSYVLSGADAAAFLVDATTGALLFVDNPDFEAPSDSDSDGIYEVTVTATDGSLDSNTIRLGLVLRDLPEAPVAADDAAAGDEDTVITGDVSLNDSDPEDDELTYSVSSGPSHGQLVLNADGTFDYTPEANFNGTDSFEYVASDPDGNTASATVTLEIAPVNDAPVAADDGVETDAKTPLDIDVATLLANDSDVDAGAVLSVVGIDTSATSGVAMLDGSTLSYNPGSAFDGLAAGETGTDTLAYTLSDEFGAQSQAVLTISVTGVNDGPAITAADGTGSVTEDADAPTLTATGKVGFDDPDLSDSHSVGVVFLSSTHGSGQLGSLGAAVTVDTTGTGTGGVVDWSYSLANASVQFLGAGDTVVETYRLTLTDTAGATTVQDVSIEIGGTNDVPTIAGVLSGSVAEDGTLEANGTVSVTDLDAGESSTQVATGAALYGTYTVDAGGKWKYILDNTRADVQALGAGNTLSDSFTIFSLDGKAAETVSIEIAGANDAPIIGGELFGAVIEDVASPDAPEATGVLTISDVDTGQSAFAAGTVTTDYGLFTLGETGEWSFDLDNTAAAVQALDTGETVDLVFAALSADGSASVDVTVRINGIDEPTGQGGGPQGDGDGSGGTQTGGAGDDVIEGGLGKDILLGGLGDDLIFGFEGSDELFGQEGFDRLLGGAGNDTHTGGTGADIFFFEADGGKDTILDFEIGLDRIGLKASDAIVETDLRVKLLKKGQIHIAYDGDAMLLEGNFDKEAVNQVVADIFIDDLL